MCIRRTAREQIKMKQIKYAHVLPNFLVWSMFLRFFVVLIDITKIIKSVKCKNLIAPWVRML